MHGHCSPIHHLSCPAANPLRTGVQGCDETTHPSPQWHPYSYLTGQCLLSRSSPVPATQWGPLKAEAKDRLMSERFTEQKGVAGVRGPEGEGAHSWGQRRAAGCSVPGLVRCVSALSTSVRCSALALLRHVGSTKQALRAHRWQEAGGQRCKESLVPWGGAAPWVVDILLRWRLVWKCWL